MGIPSCRFLDRHHDQFICTICLDVSADPVAIIGCDHVFCYTCISSMKLGKCPTCQTPFKDSKWNQIEGISRRIYLDLRMKCLNPSCDKVLTPSDYKYHDENCEITFDTCKDCGFKTRRCPNNDHSCVQVLKAELVSNSKKIEEMKTRMRTEVEKMMEDRKNETERMDKRMKEMEKRMKEKEDEMGRKLQVERKRIEHLMYICMRFRGRYYEDNGNPIGLHLDGLTNSLDFHQKMIKWFDEQFEKMKNNQHRVL